MRISSVKAVQHLSWCLLVTEPDIDVVCRPPKYLPMEKDAHECDSGILALLFAEHASRAFETAFDPNHVEAHRAKVAVDLALKTVPALFPILPPGAI